MKLKYQLKNIVIFLLKIVCGDRIFMVYLPYKQNSWRMFKRFKLEALTTTRGTRIRKLPLCIQLFRYNKDYYVVYQSSKIEL